MHDLFRDLNEYSESSTLLRAARATIDDGLDIALFGLAFDGGTLGRTGSRYGPDQVRRMSSTIREMNSVTKIAPFELCRVADIGDAPVEPFDQKAAIDAIGDFCRAVVARGTLPLAVGGDHSIALPGLRGVASRHGPVAVVHIDAHCDTYDDLAGSRYNHATPFRRAVEEGVEDPRRHVMIGIRGTIGVDMEAFEWAKAQGMTILWMEDVFELGPRAVVERVRKIIGDCPTYVSLDIDGIDPADMPGTCSPEPGGLRMRDVQVILRGLAGARIVGGDINEICPPLDPSGYTARNAAHLLFEMLCVAAQSPALPGNGS